MHAAMMQQQKQQQKLTVIRTMVETSDGVYSLKTTTAVAASTTYTKADSVYSSMAGGFQRPSLPR